MESDATARIVPPVGEGKSKFTDVDSARPVIQGSGIMHPLLVRAIRYGLIGVGALTIVSAVVNVIGAYALIEVSDEAQLGFTRNEFIAWYVGPALFGVLMIVFGALWRRKG